MCPRVQECAALGISSDVRRVAVELRGLSSQLPTHFNSLLTQLRGSVLEEAIE
jgi:hypothetical protein